MNAKVSTKPSVSDSTDLGSKPPRERILLVTRDLFYRYGIHPIGVEAIAEAALTNKMTLYRHFKSKDELIATYVRELASEGEAVWTRIAAEHPDDPQQQLDLWIAHVEEVLTNSLRTRMRPRQCRGGIAASPSGASRHRGLQAAEAGTSRAALHGHPLPRSRDPSRRSIPAV